jgi:hypothetical protein
VSRNPNRASAAGRAVINATAVQQLIKTGVLDPELPLPYAIWKFVTQQDVAGSNATA